MNELDAWLKQATRHLSKDSAAQVRAEIQEHYASSQEPALDAGATRSEADRAAIAALGDAKLASRQYRKVLLTSSDARMLREGRREARVFCSRAWLKRLSAAISAASLLAAAVCFLWGPSGVAGALLAVGLGIGFLFAAPLLPVYTPRRARLFRWVKWTVLVGAFALAFGADALKLSWLIFSSAWPIVWIEWKRMSIRRKLPVSQWPKHLYL